MAHNDLLVNLGFETFCEDCQGVGIVQHPYWAEWWQDHPNGEVPPVNDPLSKTPEEVECETCKGHGWRLTERGSAIIQLIRRWL